MPRRPNDGGARHTTITKPDGGDIGCAKRARRRRAAHPMQWRSEERRCRTEAAVPPDIASATQTSKCRGCLQLR
eukprot:4668424-Alexandrium_andersonii.AAC.1